jgi:flap endonuclease-1
MERVFTVVQLEWKNPDVEGLVPGKTKGIQVCLAVLYPVSATYGMLSEERVRKGAEKLQKFLHSKQQGRLDGFFTVKAKEPAAPKAEGKAEDKKGKAGAKSGKRVKRKVGHPY